MAIIFFDTILYAVLAWYLSHVSPWAEYGAPKPLNFCFKKSYWWPQKSEAHQPLLAMQHEENVGIEIENLSKTYSKNFCRKNTEEPALQNLNLSINKNEIFALLGVLFLIDFTFIYP